MMKTVCSSLKDKSIKVTAFPDLVILITQLVPGICKSTSEISWYIHEEMGQRRYCVHPRQRMIRRFKIHPSFPWLQKRRNNTHLVSFESKKQPVPFSEAESIR